MYTANNIANAFGGNVLTISYRDLVDIQPEEKRTADEIINRIKQGLENLNESI